MNYNKFCAILNRNIFYLRQKDFFRKLAKGSKHFAGFFLKEWELSQLLTILAILFVLHVAYATDQNTVATVIASDTYDWSQVYELTNASVSSVDTYDWSQVFESTNASVSSTDTYDWSQVYELTSASVSSVDNAEHQYQQTVSTLESQDMPTAPVVSDFSYSYDPDTNTLTLSFVLVDPDVSAIYVTVYSVVDNNIVVLGQPTTVYSGVQTTETYTVYPEPSAVYISFISEAPGYYPPDISITTPSFVIGRSIIPVNIDYSGNVMLIVSNGYSISPLRVSEGNMAYVVASRRGPVGIIVVPAR